MIDCGRDPRVGIANAGRDRLDALGQGVADALHGIVQTGRCLMAAIVHAGQNLLACCAQATVHFLYALKQSGAETGADVGPGFGEALRHFGAIGLNALHHVAAAAGEQEADLFRLGAQRRRDARAGVADDFRQSRRGAVEIGGKLFL